MAKRKPGKYDHLLPKLKKLPPQDLEYQQKVEDIKKAIRTCQVCGGSGTDDRHESCSYCNNGRRVLTGQVLVAEYAQIRAQKELLEDAVSKLGVELEAATQLLIASQENGDSDWGAYGASDRAIKMTDGDSLRVQPEVFAMVRDKTAFRDWCYKNDTLKANMELPEKKTNDLIKSLLLNGKSEPPGIEVYVRTRIVYTEMKTETLDESSVQRTDDDDAKLF